MDKQYMQGALDMAEEANKKAGIITQEECQFYTTDDAYVFRYPAGFYDGRFQYEKDTIPSTTPLKDVFDWVESCQEKIIN